MQLKIHLNIVVSFLKHEGCGMHIETALQNVPLQDRCKCPRNSAAGCVVHSKPINTQTMNSFLK